MVFHNKALLNITGILSTKDLHAALTKHLFVNHEHSKHLSLLTATQNRHSDFILGQTYKYVRKDQHQATHDQNNDRTISFLRNEVIFNDKKSIVINVRDLTTQEGLYESKAKIRQLHQAVERLSNELDHPNSAAKKNAGVLFKGLSSVMHIP